MKTKPKTRISRFTVGRLYNLGNYEHVRYELEVEIPPEKNSSDALLRVMRILGALNPKPPCPKVDFDHAIGVIAKDPSTLLDWEKANMESYRTKVARFEGWRQRRAAALKMLDKLGGAVEVTDAKLDWDDSEY